MSHPLIAQQPNNAEEEDSPQKNMDNKRWLEELAKADERGNRYRLQLEEVTRRKEDVEDKLQVYEKAVIMREEEIKRL